MSDSGSSNSTSSGDSSNSDFRSIGEILRGDGSNGGWRHETSGGASITKGPAQDPAAPGGHYISVTSSTGDKTSHLYDADGNQIK